LNNKCLHHSRWWDANCFIGKKKTGLPHFPMGQDESNGSAASCGQNGDSAAAVAGWRRRAGAVSKKLSALSPSYAHDNVFLTLQATAAAWFRPTATAETQAKKTRRSG
jgi:hypothetical protein